MANMVTGAMSIEIEAISSGSLAQSAASAAEWPGLPAEYCEARWYAAHTRANHEKRVAEQLQHRDVECFLPLYKSVRRWKDRRVLLQLPLFPGYVFVRLPLKERLRVLEVRGVACLVGFNSHPIPIPAREIEAIGNALRHDFSADPHPYLATGHRVRIKGGPLEGLSGILLRKKGNWRLVMSIDAIKQSVAIEVDADDVEPAR